ncbi:ribokinase [Dyadobacter fermentans]|uniref:Ribokinase n=1 Tax=Dyadobacter fermentans (strain ATCC 700827 / DSM 18053 / CIP 107007 / KCTC 52180 / NS114) TaxID=471854 RepID=C6VW71_DYAFD|nr:ribokinase [Dyadobacter fermentans]ACT93203.1 ribokinase [Dyadobacter fermentans DSM 18053]
MKQKVLVIGSSNTDMVVKTEHFPKPGETVLGGTFLMNPGGKGANQAVAAARLGADVRFVAKTGNDIFGKQAREGFRKEGIDISFMTETAELASGIALITVNAQGQNEIVVASGANMDLHPADIPELAFENAGLALLQLEIPRETVRWALQQCAGRNIRTVLNPAPGAPLGPGFLDGLYLITPNETETELITGITVDSEEALERAAQHLLGSGVQNVIITLGSRGIYLASEHFTGMIAAPVVEAVDTTAAGDVFNGALLKALADEAPLEEACRFACTAAAISVTRMGAQSSAPFLHELHSYNE